jgi:phosphoserine phosphatase
MKTRCTRILVVATLAFTVALGTAVAQLEDPLPSWNDGTTKQSVLDFVKRVTTSASKDFVPEAERIAVFDNDGTLWCEQPVIQGMFAVERLKQLLPEHPEWKTQQPFKAALEMDKQYFYTAGERAVMEIFAATHAGMAQEEFRRLVADFFSTARHPKLNALYKQLAYQPMVDLLRHLRANGFKTYICSGGGVHFMRLVSEEIYGIAPEQVIGSSLLTEFSDVAGKIALQRLPKLGVYNDQEVKPVSIDLHVGRKPVFAAGNVRSGGDVAMLRYSQSSERPSLQLLINHDDAKREFAYSEKDNVSLTAASKHGWTVVSMKNDWKRIFSFENK